MRSLPPERILTERLVIRCWKPEDAPLLKAAIDSSLEHLRPWMEWALAEPSQLDVITARLSGFRDAFLTGRDFFYGIFDAAETEVLGGTGLHPRRAAGLEIGYWIRADATGQGLASEAAQALTRVALDELGAARVEIHCDPDNVRSAAIPQRLGYRLREIVRGNALTPDGRPRDTMVWEIGPA